MFGFNDKITKNLLFRFNVYKYSKIVHHENIIVTFQEIKEKELKTGVEFI